MLGTRNLLDLQVGVFLCEEKLQGGRFRRGEAVVKG